MATTTLPGPGTEAEARCGGIGMGAAPDPQPYELVLGIGRHDAGRANAIALDATGPVEEADRALQGIGSHMISGSDPSMDAAVEHRAREKRSNLALYRHYRRK